VYADANVPAGLVTFMRVRLRWDVFFVLEHDGLRRARDTEHYRLARQLRRTLVTLDRDYLDDRRFPPSESSGVVVISAPHERDLARVLRRIDRALFAHLAVDNPVPSTDGSGLPLEGRKLHAQADWTAPPAGS
jgi:predicted nuclease of predicted toxin-antitoxin system